MKTEEIISVGLGLAAAVFLIWHESKRSANAPVIYSMKTECDPIREHLASEIDKLIAAGAENSFFACRHFERAEKAYSAYIINGRKSDAEACAEQIRRAKQYVNI